MHASVAHKKVFDVINLSFSQQWPTTTVSFGNRLQGATEREVVIEQTGHTAVSHKGVQGTVTSHKYFFTIHMFHNHYSNTTSMSDRLWNYLVDADFDVDTHGYDAKMTPISSVTTYWDQDGFDTALSVVLSTNSEQFN